MADERDIVERLEDEQDCEIPALDDILRDTMKVIVSKAKLDRHGEVARQIEGAVVRAIGRAAIWGAEDSPAPQE